MAYLLVYLSLMPFRSRTTGGQGPGLIIHYYFSGTWYSVSAQLAFAE